MYSGKKVKQKESVGPTRAFRLFFVKTTKQINFRVIYNRIQKEAGAILLRRSKLILAAAISPGISSLALRKAVGRYRLEETRDSTLSLAGKRVALIGPSSTGTSVSDLRSFDVIARLGFTGAGSSATGEFLRCDISFLARWHGNQLASQAGETGISLDQSMKLMLRWDVWQEDEGVLKALFETSRFSIQPCDELFGAVTPNFAPHVILWLLACRPKELHLSHMDLFTEPNYPGGYAVNKQVRRKDNSFTRPPSTVRRSFAEFHNPFTHFEFFRSLSSLNAVTFSRELEHLIREGKSSYRKKIEALYYDRR